MKFLRRRNPSPFSMLTSFSAKAPWRIKQKDARLTPGYFLTFKNLQNNQEDEIMKFRRFFEGREKEEVVRSVFFQSHLSKMQFLVKEFVFMEDFQFVRILREYFCISLLQT